MEGTRRTKNPAIRGVHGYNMAPSQGNMQSGRFVAAQNIHLKPFRQMMVGPNTYQRTSIDHTTATADTKETSTRQLKLASENRYSTNAHAVINKEASKIERGNFSRNDALSPCLFVATKLALLVKRFGYNNQYNTFITEKIGTYYSEYLDSALENLKHKFATGCSWEYQKELDSIAKHFKFHPDDPLIKCHRKALEELYKKSVETELNYIEYTNHDPILKDTVHSFNIIKKIFSPYSPALLYSFLSEKDIRENKKRQQMTTCYVLSNVPTDSQITKKLDYLDSKQSSVGTLNSNDRRMYRNLICAKISIILKGKPPGKYTNFHDHAYLLKNVSNMCSHYIDIINDLPFLEKSIKKIVHSISMATLLIIKWEKETHPSFKEVFLHYISILNKYGYLNKECEQLYIKCKEQETVIDSDTFTAYQYKIRLHEIQDTLKSNLPNNFLTAANMLKELLNEKKEEITKIDSSESLINQIESIKRRLYRHLFKAIFDSYNLCMQNNMNEHAMSHVLSIHQRSFMEANQYTFILKYDNYRTTWNEIGCIIFYNEIYELSKRIPISEEDAIKLLYIKRIIPRLPNLFVSTCAENILMNCLENSIDNVGYLSTETTNELSEWVDILSISRSVHHRLTSLNNQWKNKIMNPETSMATSNRFLISTTHDKYKLANQTHTPHCPPFAQSTFGNQASIPPITMMSPLSVPRPAQAFCDPHTTLQYPLFQPTMPHAEYRPKNPLNSSTQQTVTRSFEPPRELSQLQSIESSATQIPTQNRWHPSHPEFPPPFPPPFPPSFPPPFPPPYQRALSQQASFMPTGGCPMPGAMSHQNIPMYRTKFKIDDPALDKILQQLLNASDLYQTQKDKPADTLLTDPSSDYYSLLENGMRLLTSWIIQLEGLTIPKDDIYRSLMGITKKDGHQIVFNLFEKFMTHIHDRKTISNILYLRNYLFSMRTSIRMSKQ